MFKLINDSTGELLRFSFNFAEIKGFEISIEYQDRKSCIQIVPLNSQNKPGRVTTYRFKIKDPTFMTIKQDKYNFYFGRANIKALIECEWSGLDGNKNNATSMNLCSAENTISPSVDIGILKIKDVNIDFLRPGKSRCFFSLSRIYQLLKPRY